MPLLYPSRTTPLAAVNNYTDGPAVNTISCFDSVYVPDYQAVIDPLLWGDISRLLWGIYLLQTSQPVAREESSSEPISLGNLLSTEPITLGNGYLPSTEPITLGNGDLPSCEPITLGNLLSY